MTNALDDRNLDLTSVERNRMKKELDLIENELGVNVITVNSDGKEVGGKTDWKELLKK